MRSPPNESAEDLDTALEALFDAPPASPNPSKQGTDPKQPSISPTTPPEIPETPETSPKKVRGKSILEHLADNKKRLSVGAARVAEDLRKLAEAQSTANVVAEKDVVGEHEKEKKSSIKEAMAARRRPKKQPTRNAFTVIGRESTPGGTAHAMTTYGYVDRKITNMNLIETPYSQPRLEAIFEHTPRLDISDIKSRHEELRSGSLKDYTIFACLVKKIRKKQARNGKMFAVWSICNMPRGPYDGKEVAATVVRLLLFDEAYESFHTRCEGTIFALRRPGLLPPRKKEDSDESIEYALRMSKKENIVVLGACKDFKLCEARKTDGEQCGEWYHAHHMTNCVKHTKKRLRGLTTGTRMDIQNAIRPNLKDPVKAIRAPVDISGPGIGGDEEIGEGERKRLRDSQRAKDMKKRSQIVRSLNLATGMTRNLVVGKSARKGKLVDRATSIARETRQVRIGNAERHDRLLGLKDRQKRYNFACEVLYSLGFLLREDGGWDPPVKSKFQIVTPVSHRFDGKGRVKRRRTDDFETSGMQAELDGKEDGEQDERKEQTACDGNEDRKDAERKEHALRNENEDSQEDEKKEKTCHADRDEEKCLADDKETEVEGDGRGRTEQNGEDKNMEAVEKQATDEAKSDEPNESEPCQDQELSKPPVEPAAQEGNEDIVLSDESDDD